MVSNQSSFAHVLADIAPGFAISEANMIVTLQKESGGEVTSTDMLLGPAPSTLPGTQLDWAMGCGTTNYGFFSQLACGAVTLQTLYNNGVSLFSDPTVPKPSFFPSSDGGMVNVNTPQVIRISTDPSPNRVSVAFQPFNAASWAQARYTNTVIDNTPNVDSGTYSFAKWWHCLFDGAR